MQHTLFIYTHCIHTLNILIEIYNYDNVQLSLDVIVISFANSAAVPVAGNVSVVGETAIVVLDPC